MWTRLLLFLAAAFVFVLAPFASPLHAQTTAIYYVDPIAGDDNALGASPERPFRSIERAQSSAREAVAKGLSVVVFLAGGLYELDEPIRFTPADAGPTDGMATYRSLPGESPVLSGGKRLQPKFQRVEASIWRAEIEPGLNFRQLYIDGHKGTRARTPNKGSFRKFAVDKQENGFNIDIDLIEGVESWEGIEIVPKCKWMHKRLLLQTVTPLNNRYARAVVRSDLWDAIVNGIQGMTRYIQEDYWLENSPAFLDDEGEWFYDSITGELLIFSRVETAPKEIIIPMLPTLISLEGSFDEPVRNITFKGIIFKYTGWAEPNINGFVDVQSNTLLPTPHGRRGNPEYRHNQRKDRIPAAVNILTGQNIQVKNCQFTDLGGTGLTFNYGGEANIIASNRFTEIAASAIEIGNDANRPSDHRMWPRRYLVFNNHIENIGTEYFGSIGIKAFYIDGLRVWNNLIRNIPYTGICVGWGWDENELVLETRDVSIKYNKVDTYLTELRDGAALYSANPVFGGIMEGNYLKNMVSDWPDPALYNDGAGAYWVLRSNVIEGANRWLGQQSWDVQHKRDILAVNNYTTTDLKSIHGVNRIVRNHSVYPDADWPACALSIIAVAGLTDAKLPGLPPKETDLVFIIDNSDPGFSTCCDEWITFMGIMEAAEGYYGEDYAHTYGGSVRNPIYAQWQQKIPESGDYNIYIRYPVMPAGNEYATIEIVYGDGGQLFGDFTYNQRNKVFHNQWIFLGRFPMEADVNAKVRILTAGSGTTIADVVKLIKVEDAVCP